MQYLYHIESGQPNLNLTGDEHRYIFKVRRQRAGEQIALRNLKNQLLYLYLIESLDKKSATLTLLQSQESRVEAKKALHIGWCIIDPKKIEKFLPTLNEIGVAKITFIVCQRSQNEFKVDFERLHKILLNSSQQCGRSVTMELGQEASLAEFLSSNPQASMLNFSSNLLSSQTNIDTIIVGCEGGFTPKERELFAPDKIVAFESDIILRSESAVCAAASKLLL